MPPVSRRRFMELSCACACGTAIQLPDAASSASRLSSGCILTPAGFQAYRAFGYGAYAINDIFTRRVARYSTGNAGVDRELNLAVKIAAATLGVNPAFGFFEPEKFTREEIEFDSMGAFAWPSDVDDVPGTRGVVGVGLAKLRSELYGHDESGTSVMAIIAHEFGHVVQRLRGYLTGVPTLVRENNADFISGYYLGTRKLRVPFMRFDRALDLFERLGKSENGNPYRDHGDSRERPAAAEAGYRVALGGKPLDAAVREGLIYVGYGHLAL